MKKTLRRSIAVAGAAALVALAGCSTDRGDSDGGAGVGANEGEAANDGILEIMGWGGTTWNQNFNTWSPTASAVTPGTSFFYEPLVRVDRVSGGEVLPYLAEDWEFNDEGSELTFHLRQDVTWSDGEPLTSADVAYSWDLALSDETAVVYPFDDYEVVDEHTITVDYGDTNFTDLVAFGSRPIIPEHIWQEEDVASWTNPEPVGTGPFELDSFSPQQVQLSLRDDYWGPDSNGVQTVRFRAMSPEAGRDALLKGELDYTTMGWENAEEEFVAVDPETNVYNFYPVGGSDGYFFNTLEAPYDDPAVRRALRDSLDLQTAADLVRVGYDVPTKAGFDPVVMEDFLPEDPSDWEQNQDAEAALAELENAGWSVENGQLLDSDGEAYSVVIDVYQPYTEWVLTAQIMADQWGDALGLDVDVNQLGENQYSEVIDEGRFGIVSGVSMPGNTTMYNYFRYFDSSLVGEPGDNQSGNDAFWQNEDMDEVTREIAAIPPGEEEQRLQELARAGQMILTEEAPAIHVATAGWKATLYTGKWDGWPTPGETDYVPNNTLLADPILTVLNLHPREG
ncbi:ABC transporter substrate-binding protein [Pseudactinotalea sp. Z1748]|uniref:ABC transporter substrate-binding protein n=1 Tax=Pseudactinotalea sp. Z1748 TaxID=3413027 RepID=UPI003C7A494E